MPRNRDNYPVDAAFADHWQAVRDYEEARVGNPPARRVSPAQTANRDSKTRAIVAYVIEQNGTDAAAWEDTIRLLSTRQGVADFVTWKRNRPDREAWAVHESVIRGVNAIRKRFDAMAQCGAAGAPAVVAAIDAWNAAE